MRMEFISWSSVALSSCAIRCRKSCRWTSGGQHTVVLFHMSNNPTPRSHLLLALQRPHQLTCTSLLHVRLPLSIAACNSAMLCSGSEESLLLPMLADGGCTAHSSVADQDQLHACSSGCCMLRLARNLQQQAEGSGHCDRVQSAQWLLVDRQALASTALDVTVVYLVQSRPVGC